jgi:hypothetical protein
MLNFIISDKVHKYPSRDANRVGEIGCKNNKFLNTNTKRK